MGFSFHNGSLIRILIVSTVLGTTAYGAKAQSVELEQLCQSFPRNSRCENYVLEDGEGFTPPAIPPQIIRVRLGTRGNDVESVFIELNEQMSDETVLAAYYVKSFEGDGLISGLLNGTIDAFSPVPVPFDLFQNSSSAFSQTEYLSFTPDSCEDQLSLTNGFGLQSSDCTISGTDTISLQEGMDIREGAFMLGYAEGELLRALSFRISDHDATFEEARETDRLCQTYPLNYRCRYWPLSAAE